MRLSEWLPEAITGPPAVFYSNVPGRLLGPAQRKLGEMVDQVLPADARLAVDVGCGPGRLAIEIARRRPGMKVVAVDLSPTMVRIAGRNGRDLPNLEVRCENAARMSAADGSADMIVSAESMHHWRQPVAVLDEFYRVLRPSGRAWIFDGRDDFAPEELRGWTLWGEGVLPRPAAAVMRVILRTHGFPQDLWQNHVPALVRQSRFGTGTIEPFAMYRRVELLRPAGKD